MSVSSFDRQIIGIAMGLVNRVHYGKPADTHAFLVQMTPEVMRAVLIVYAEMIPQDQTPGELRQWKRAPERTVRMPLQPRSSGYVEACGSQAAWVRHVTYDEAIDEACQVAHERYLFTHPIRRAA